MTLDYPVSRTTVPCDTGSILIQFFFFVTRLIPGCRQVAIVARVSPVGHQGEVDDPGGAVAPVDQPVLVVAHGGGIVSAGKGEVEQVVHGPSDVFIKILSCYIKKNEQENFFSASQLCLI